MAKSKRSIIVFSRWFPYNKRLEQSFHLEELKILSYQFENVYLVPQFLEGDIYDFSKELFLVDDSLPVRLNKINFISKVKALCSPHFLFEIPNTRFSFKKIKRAYSSLLASFVIRVWLNEFLTDKSNVVLYSFWLDQSSLASSMIKNPAIVKVVSRCHNYDLYGNESNGYYVPFRKKIINNLDIVLPDSNEGKSFLLNRYPKANIQIGLMGTKNCEIKNKLSEDDVIRLISCSYLIPRKRVLLLAKAIKKLGFLYPECHIEWTHVGTGPDMKILKETVVNFDTNIKVNLPGNLGTTQLNNLYNSNNYDLFINTSTKEGTPVSIIEAISRAIPILATAFGGGKEIVEWGGGMLLSADPSPEEIAEAIHEMTSQKSNLLNFSNKALRIWDEHYNSEKNYVRFSELLRSE